MTARRDLQPELMDDPGISTEDHALALRGLARLNRASMIERTVLRALRPYLGEQPLSVLDVAAGSGDLITSLARSTSGYPVRFTGCDISETACRHMRSGFESLGEAFSDRLTSVRLDGLSDPLPQGYDIVMCHLFLHHLSEPDIVHLLSTMRDAARRAVIVTDLRRSRRGYALALLASRLLTRSHVVHTDALLSVRGALTNAELRDLAIRSGYGEPCIQNVWPQRMLLTWKR
jgi:2-polyprenyl-3-methyl-5-hydroxy-6-metoxy-1,4-benzoquinol methylase